MSDNNNNNNNNSDNHPATPTATRKDSQKDDSWKDLKKDNAYLALAARFTQAQLLQGKYNNMLGCLRSNPQSSRSKSFSESAETSEPSPQKKPKVGEAEHEEPIAIVEQEKLPNWKYDTETKAVNAIVGEWKKMLSPPQEEHASQGTASQSSTGTAAESVSSSYDEQDSKLRFKRDCTHDKQLGFLKLRRTEGNVTPKLKKGAEACCEDWQSTRRDGKKNEYNPLSAAFEECLTQPFVNDLIIAALPHLQSYAKPKLKQAATELMYYCETRHQAQANLSRKPDGLLYVTGEGSDPKLTKEAQQIGPLMAVECKSDLNQTEKLNTALREVERDAAEKAKSENFLQPETMCGLTSDGVSWKFHFFRWELDAETVTVKLCREDSPTLLLTEGMDSIAEWLVFSLMRSLKDQNTNDVFEVEIPVGEAIMTQVYESKSALRPQIFRARKQSNDEVVVKFFDFTRVGSHVATFQKYADRLMKERNYLLQLHGHRSFVSLAECRHDPPLFEKYVLCMEDAGTALTSFIVSGMAGKSLAKIVYSDIWVGALSALREKELCFADIHPGNICVKDGVARLVDLESMKALGESLDQSPILLRHKAPKFGELAWDEASVAAILCCLWDDGSFDKLENYANEFYMTPDKRKGFIKTFCRNQENTEVENF